MLADYMAVLAIDIVEILRLFYKNATVTVSVFIFAYSPEAKKESCCHKTDSLCHVMFSFAKIASNFQPSFALILF